MRIAQVVASYHPRVGGVETHVRRIAEACAVAGGEVTVLTHGDGDATTVEETGTVRVLRFPRTVPSARYPLSLPLFRYLAGHAEGFDVVHAHSYHTLACQAAARSGLPFVFTPHYHGTGHTPAARLMHRVYRPARDCSPQPTPSSACRGPRATSSSMTSPRWRRRSGSYRTAQISGRPLDRQEAVRAGAPALLAIGRLERYKNVDLIIRAFDSLKCAATLTVVGDGPDRPRLERLGGSRVRFTGRVSDAELDALLVSANVVTSASDHEAFGLVIADGLTAGARVVASRIPAHLEIGRLAGADAPITYADPRNTAEYSAALAKALAMGKASAGRAWLPSWGDVAAQTCELYACVSAHGGGVRHKEPA